VEFAFRPSEINGQHWILSKNSGSFPNWGVYLTGSAGSGRLVAFFNVSSTISCSLVSPTASITTGSNYIVDASLIPSTGISRLYINSETAATGLANGAGSLSATAPLFFSNINSGSNLGTVNSIFNIKAYTPRLTAGLVRQNYNAISNRLGLPAKAWIASVADYLLDTYSGAAAAYSLRQLSVDYTGFAIRVRRSSDNSETNVGFDINGNLDTATLLAFCGAGNGFVTTWYDQSGNTRNATQSTASNQPQIVSSGNIITLNSKPTMTYDGLNDFMLTPQFSYSTALSLYYVTQRVGNATGGTSYNPDISIQSTNGTDQGAFHYINPSLKGASYPFNTAFSNYDGFGTYTNGDKYLINFDMTNNIGYDVYRNNTLEKSTATSGTIPAVAQGFYIAYQNSPTRYAYNNFSEIIMWLTNQNNNRININSNINSYYNIY
jgi:hypothetical protein